MRATFIRLLVTLPILGVLVPSAPLAAPEAPAPETVEALVDRVVRNQLDAAGIPGATVAAVLGGETVLAKGYGVADVEDGRPVDALFRIGSVGKLVTFTAVLQLAEQGRLDLDADVASYLDFPLPARLERHPFRGDPGPITLAHLLTHTAGFEDARGGYSLDADGVPSLADTMRERMPARIFRPGEAVAYSNYGAALAGYVVERVAGQPFAEYVEQRDRFVFTAMTPAGSTSTTANDMARFLLAHLGDGGGILAPQTLASMHERQFGHHPRLDGMAFGFVERTVNGQRALFHGGDIFSYQSGLFLLPEHDLGLFVAYADGFLGVDVLGESTRFAEIEPGVYTALREGHRAFPYGALNTLVFRTDAHGRRLLFTDGKVSYEAAPWYRTTGVTLLAIGGTALLCLLTLLGWALASAVGAVRRQRAPRSRLARVTRWTAGVFAGSVLVSLLGVALIAGSIDPILGQPLAAFGAQPAWSPLLLVPEALLVVTGVALTPLAAIVWRRRLWGVPARPEPAEVVAWRA